MRQQAQARLEVPTNEKAIALFGHFDSHLKLLEEQFPVRIIPRGQEITISGDEEAVSKVESILEQLLQVVEKGNLITAQDVSYAMQMAQEDESLGLSDLFGDVVVVTARGKHIKPRTQGQKGYVDAIRSSDIVFGIGPAGTGKTYLAMAMAVKALKSRAVSRIVLTRPAVEAGEKLGFLPGDMQEKVDPYLRPLYDALFDIMGADTYRRHVERGTIEIAPLAYMRGRTLDDSFILLDEAQNTTSEQMKMFLTRMGFGSKAVVTGDVTQIDLPRGRFSGLQQVRSILEQTDGIAFVYLGDKDVVRHPVVQRVVRAYAAYEAALAEPGEQPGEPGDD